MGEVGKRMDTRIKVIQTSAGHNKRSVLNLWATEPRLCYGDVAILVCPVSRMVESWEGEVVRRFPPFELSGYPELSMISNHSIKRREAQQN